MQIPISLQKKLHAFAYTVLFMFLLGISVYAIFYLSSDRRELIDWYLSLGSIYQQATWPELFFSPNTKSRGNVIVVFALFTAVTAGIFVLRRMLGLRSREYPPLEIHCRKQDVVACTGIAILLFFMWVWGYGAVQPAYDEVFSVVFAAEAHLFHTLSYYMLPNNHILFNALNNLVFGFVDDKVVSARIISLFAFVMTGLWQYFWFRDIVKGRWTAVGMVVLSGSVLPVLGFAVQGRGYMLMVLACWVSFISFYFYFKNRRKIWLYVLALSCFVGYTTLPSFLYFHVALLIFAAINQIKRKHFDLNFFTTQLWSGVSIFLFYLPALTFSGTSAFTDNRYVKPLAMSFYEFGVFFLPQLPHHVNYAVANVFEMESYWGPVIFLVPVLLLFFNRDKPFRQIAIFYVILIATTILIVIKMKVTPYYRTSVFQLQFGVVCFVLFVFAILETVFSRQRRWLNSFFAILLVMVTFFNVQRNAPLISYFLYYYDINSTHQSLTEFFTDIPKTATVAVSDEAYYLYYLGKKNGYHAALDMNVSASYIIKLNHEVLAGVDLGLYKRVSEWQGYELYKRTVD